MCDCHVLRLVTVPVLVYAALYAKSHVFTVEEAMAAWESASPGEHLSAINVETAGIRFPDWGWVMKERGIPFVKIPSITKQHHFIFEASAPWTCKISVSGDPDQFGVHQFFRPDVGADERPSDPGFYDGIDEVPPKGLTLQRQWYLFREVACHYVPETQRTGIWAQPEGEFVPYKTDDQLRIADLEAQLAGDAEALGGGESDRGSQRSTLSTRAGAGHARALQRRAARRAGRGRRGRVSDGPVLTRVKRSQTKKVLKKMMKTTAA